MSYKKPSESFDMEFPKGDAVSFDVSEFDEQLDQHGVRFIHYRAMPCPVGMIDRHDSRKPHDDHEGCSNGLIYVEAGTLRALFTGNSMSKQLQDMGFADGSTVSITVPRFYEGTETPVHLYVADRMVLADVNVSVVHTQMFEAHATGVDKMTYPVSEVEHLVDASGVRYKQGQDFIIEKGNIKWTGTNRPGTNVQNDKGVICAIRYRYIPCWYVKNLVHEIRVVQHQDMLGERSLHRVPYSALLQREYVFEQERRDADAKDPNSPRQQRGPPNGSFGAR